ncbi:nucleosome assembly protein 1;3-like [Rosa rugosa]|uniref:nucleosome assembly protein 1;3-like n=1 Tax=Rosa rugosa TaxID=74645 RepID=UPI002B414C87|nr:nucleosome assembly protein 1;3-like [Rosa rugosa]
MSSSRSGFIGSDHNLNSEGRDPGLTAQKQIKSRITPKIVKRVHVLRQMEGQHKKLEQQFFEDRAALVDKYHQLYKPLYEKRYEIVNGITEVEGVKTPDQGQEATEEKGVPNFWLSALKNNKELLIMEHDEHALQYLKDIKWSRIHDPKGFRLEFLFDPNPYFRNSVLTKTYYMIEEHEPIWSKEIGTEIDWYPGQSLTISPRKDPKNAKSMTAADICYSFFTFFKPPQHDDYTGGADMLNNSRQDHPLRGVMVHWGIKLLKDSSLRMTMTVTIIFTLIGDDEDEEGAAADDKNKEEEDGKRKELSGWTNAERAMAGLTLQ